MAHCSNCGRDDATKVVIRFMENGVQIGKCNHCAPPGDPDISERFIDPSDKKLWPDWVVNPKGYKKVGDTLVATDETLSDLQEEVLGSPVADEELETAKEKKRAFARERNQKPMTQIEIDQTVAYYRKQAEEDRVIQGALDAGLVLP